MRSSLVALALIVQAALSAVCFAQETEKPVSIGYFDAIAQEAAPVVGETYHMRHCIMHEKGTHLATNYWRGGLLPINTQVTLVSLKKKTMKLRVVETGEEVEIENVPDFTKKDIPTIARNMLTRTPVPLDGFGAEIARKIKNGELASGMTREQVVMARGYPPSHKTSSLSQDTWTYWSSRFVVLTIVFEDGVLARGRGIE